MTIWIPEYLSKNKTESSDNQTLYIDLPKNEQISFLGIEVSAQGSATPRTTTTLIDEIEKYEVMGDGSKQLFSLEPELAYYIDFITRDGIYPPLWPNYTPNARCGHEFIIPFGRYLYDEEYLLDTSLYNNVQLQIPYNIDNARWTTGTFRHNVVMYRPLEKLRPKGFIRSRVFRKETSNAAVETLEHKLPMSYPLRYVAARFEDLDQNISTDVTAIKVNVDEGRLILGDLNINEWRDADKRRYPRKHGYWVSFALTDATYVKAHTDYPYPEAILSSAVRAFMVKLSAAIGEQVAMNIYEHDGTTAGGGHAFSILVSGPNPHKCLTLIDGRKQPFDAPVYSEGKVEYTMAAYTTIVHTFGQEVVVGALA
jgi:hypothetical protein